MQIPFQQEHAETLLTSYSNNCKTSLLIDPSEFNITNDAWNQTILAKINSEKFRKAMNITSSGQITCNLKNMLLYIGNTDFPDVQNIEKGVSFQIIDSYLQTKINLESWSSSCL